MFKIIKYKFISTLEDKKFIFLFLVYIIYINYAMFAKSGLLTMGSKDFNVDFKYALIVNNFKVASLLIGIILPIYLGYNVIGKDIDSRHLDIILISVKNRTQYIVFTMIGNMIIVIFMQLIMLINLLVIILALNLNLMWNEVLNINLNSLLNMLVILSIVTLFTILFKGIIGIISGCISLVIFNIHTYLMIPFANVNLNLSLNLRRILITLIPIEDAAVESIVNTGYEIMLQIPKPFFISNISLYQIVFIIILSCISIFCFEKKDL